MKTSSTFSITRLLLLALILILRVAPTASAVPINISTRLVVRPGDDNAAIAGFVIQGRKPTKVLIRALGPSLAAAGVSGTLDNPTLALTDSRGQVLESNASWQQGMSADAVRATGRAPTDARECAIVARLNPGSYTAVVRSESGQAGVVLVEVYSLDGPDTALPINLSTRGRIEGGDGVMIGGFVILERTRKVAILAKGPSLAAVGVAGTLDNPSVQLVQGATVFGSNDNWESDAAAAATLRRFGIAPTNPAEAALVMDLAPGSYTAIVRGAGTSTGVGIVEIYDLSPNPTAFSVLDNLAPTESVGTTVFDPSTGGVMMFEGLKGSSGLMSKVRRVTVGNAARGVYVFANVDVNGMVTSIETSAGEQVRFRNYNATANTVEVLQASLQANSEFPVRTMSLPAGFFSLVNVFRDGRFATVPGVPAARIAAGKVELVFQPSARGADIATDDASTPMSPGEWTYNATVLLASLFQTATDLNSAPAPTTVPGAFLYAANLVYTVFDLTSQTAGVVTGRNIDPTFVFSVISSLVNASTCAAAITGGTAGTIATGGIAAAAAIITSISACYSTGQAIGDFLNFTNAGSISFASSNVFAREGETAEVFIVRRTGSRGAVSGDVQVVAAGTTAGNPTDYSFSTQRVTFADGDSAPKILRVPLVNNTVQNPAKTVHFELFNAMNGRIGLPGETAATVTILDDDLANSFIQGKELVVEYTWPAGQRDLDTATTFLGGTVGYAASSSAPYVRWTGDDQTAGGSEVATIDLDGAFTARAVGSSFVIDCKAGWYAPAGGSGSATLNVYFRPKDSTGFGATVARRTIVPGTQSSVASTPVGRIQFTVSPTGYCTYTFQ